MTAIRKPLSAIFTAAAITWLTAALAACGSPESSRSSNEGTGADRGNRGPIVRMHEGSQPYVGTPRLAPAEPPSLAPAEQAKRLSAP